MPASNYIFKVNNVNTKTRCEICSKLTIKIFYILNNKHILHPVLLFLMLTLSRWMPAGMPSFREIWTNARYISDIFEWRCRFWKEFSSWNNKWVLNKNLKNTTVKDLINHQLLLQLQLEKQLQILMAHTYILHFIYQSNKDSMFNQELKYFIFWEADIHTWKSCLLMKYRWLD